MLTILTKRKEKHQRDHAAINASLDSRKELQKNKLFEGSFELIDLMYEYITTNSSGLISVYQFADILNQHLSGIEECFQYQKRISTSSATLKEQLERLQKMISDMPEDRTDADSSKELADTLSGMHAEIDSLTQACDFLTLLESEKKQAEMDLSFLERQRQDNAILLNDLVSFLVQLKTILTALKEDH